MKKTLMLLFFVGCQTVPLTKFQPTTRVALFQDLDSIPMEYFEIGVLEYEGEATTKEILLQKIIEMAKARGAEALIKISFNKSKETWQTTQVPKGPGYEWIGDPYRRFEKSKPQTQGVSSKTYTSIEATMIRFK